MPSFTFAAPCGGNSGKRIHPVFLAFMGCPQRCVFCAQEAQSGAKPRPFAVVLQELEAFLENASASRNFPEEIAFYGGTFTLLPVEEQLACLALVSRYKGQGGLARVRASTRPDAVPAPLLETLARAGLDMLELGVQSFSDTALDTSSRGYDGETARIGCKTVIDGGLALGIQLMPGMPGMEEAAFPDDWRTALAFSPAALRLYPCLVLEGTALATMHAGGEFIPWSLERTVPLLANALLAAWKANVPVIRMGLAPQGGRESGGIIAGPHHPALGSMVRGLALFTYIREQTAHLGPLKTLRAPGRFQGEFWGHKGSLVAGYAGLGLAKTAVSFGPETAFTVTF